MCFCRKKIVPVGVQPYFRSRVKVLFGQQMTFLYNGEMTFAHKPHFFEAFLKLCSSVALTIVLVLSAFTNSLTINRPVDTRLTVSPANDPDFCPMYWEFRQWLKCRGATVGAFRFMSLGVGGLGPKP